MNNLRYIFSSLLSILLIYFSWIPNNYTILIFFIFIPLFYLIDNFSRNTKYYYFKIFLIFFINFFVANFLITSWIIKANIFGGIFACFLNAFLMSCVIFISLLVKNYFGNNHFYLFFIFFWISFEYFHLNWDLSWPWLTLGNVFSSSINWIQWYEYTGVFGGSLWILLSNVTIYKLLFELRFRIDLKLIFGMLLITLPMLISHFIIFFGNFDYLNLNKKKNKINISVVQPNLDPYHTKFSLPLTSQIKIVDSLISLNNFNSNIILLPENFLHKNFLESSIDDYLLTKKFYSLLKNDSNKYIVTGVTTSQINKKFNLKNNNQELLNERYNIFNSSMLINTNSNPKIYHKSKLVPGAEKIPYPNLFGYFLHKFPIYVGGLVGNYGKNDSIFNFSSKFGKFSTMICYESVYGEFVSKFIKKGANWIFIMTNDGWWGNSFGHIQHNYYARLRAIENRKFIGRSANTGISCIINPFGKEINSLSYDTLGIINGKIYSNNKITFYAKNGDFIAIFSFILVLIYIFSYLLNTTNNFLR